MFADLTGLFEKGSLQGKLAPAIVINNNDPTKTQRVQYRISTIHQGRTDAELVWAIPIGWSTQGNSAGIGDISVPQIGAKILIFFPENDEHDTYYFADYHDKSTQIVELQENYPNSYGRIDSSGNLWLVNTQTNTVRFIHVTGSYIKINADGSTECGSQQTLNVFAHGALNLRSAGAVNIDGTTVNINQGAAATLTMTARTRPAPVNAANQTDY
ncbi:MAG TPA: phage baseplate assembly protein V [Nitrosopumilaceae archaeon]|jgi:hypothetical protein|nr:phage baseplate assembly protein V [Nitrosopumilaceae archaeon]